ncbi:MAG: hypothetical protein RL596_965 [Bacteroidota bacterium]
MKNKIFIGFCLLLLCNILFAQEPKIQILDSSQKVSYRGLSVVTDNIVWVSGSNGTVGRSIDGGKNWGWMKVKGYEKRDFRDIAAFDKNTAIVLAVAEPGLILKTKDGGKNWYKVFEDTTKGVFIDAMDFTGNKGYAIGDPLDQHLYLLKTTDFGEHWRKIKPENTDPIFAANEAFFASSGSNIYAGKKSLKNKLLFVSGGSATRLFSMPSLSAMPLELQLKMGGSSGANSIAISPNEKYGMIVGGDYAADTMATANSNIIIFRKGYIEMITPETAPHGYRSCVTYINENTLLTCGTSGIDISKDGGKNWTLISPLSFHVCATAKKGNTVYLAGSTGKIAKLIL